jgi:hypothetical protein
MADALRRALGRSGRLERDRRAPVLGQVAEGLVGLIRSIRSSRAVQRNLSRKLEEPLTSRRVLAVTCCSVHSSNRCSCDTGILFSKESAPSNTGGDLVVGPSALLRWVLPS